MFIFKPGKFYVYYNKPATMLTTYKTIDLSAPRFNEKSLSLCNRKTLKHFFKKHPEYANVSPDLLQDIIYTFNGMLYQNVIDNRDGTQLPESLGSIFIGSCKPAKKENLDKGKSQKYDTRIINRNLDTDGYVAKIFYTNYEEKYKFKHRELWVFKGSRNFTRTVSKAYRVDWPKYIMVEEYRKIASLFRNTKLKDLKARDLPNKPIAEDYNEFDID